LVYYLYRHFDSLIVISLLGLYGLGSFHFCFEFAGKLFHLLGHLQGIHLGKIVEILNWVLAAVLLQVEDEVAKKPKGMSYLRGLIEHYTFCQ
jgi:hypothetical protein